MIYLSAGHHFRPRNADPGAVANGYKENELTRELRDLVALEIKQLGGALTIDKDFETLAEYIGRIKPGTGSVVCELHFNASGNPSATGVETIIKQRSDAATKMLAMEVTDIVSKHTRLVNRGVKDETQSHRGRLAILNTSAGMSILPEICFVSNRGDMLAYQQAKGQIAKELAAILVRYDALRA